MSVSPGMESDAILDLPPDDATLERYLARRASAREQTRIDAWLASDARLRARVEGLQRAMCATDTPRTLALGVAEQWGDCIVAGEQRPVRSDGARPSAGRPFQTPSRMRPMHELRPWYRSPASVVTAIAGLAAALTVAVMRYDRTPAPTTSKQFSTAAGQRATVTLRAGARATLGPATTLDVTLERGQTTVWVRGEALFTVEHGADAPFVVRTARSITRVLGTTFLVRQYESDATARIVVAEGRVSVQSLHGTTPLGRARVLAANMLGVVGDSGAVSETHNVAINDYTGWTTGTLTFRSAKARDIIADLSRVYGAELRIMDSTLAKQKLDWYVETRNVTLTQALHELAVMLEAHVVKSNDVITLVPGRREMRRVRSPLPSAAELQHGR